MMYIYLYLYLNLISIATSVSLAIPIYLHVRVHTYLCLTIPRIYICVGSERIFYARDLKSFLLALILEHVEACTELQSLFRGLVKSYQAFSAGFDP